MFSVFMVIFRPSLRGVGHPKVMIALILFLICVFMVCALGGLAALSDFRGMKIPNLYSILIFAAFPVCYAVVFLSGHAGDVFYAPLSHVMSFGLVFVLTLGLFVAKLWGAGDQKMISAFSIWFGLPHLIVFLFYTVLFGGVLGVLALILRKFKPIKAPKEGSWIAQVQGGGNKVPYGIAIFCGALVSFVKIGYFDVDTFRIFLTSLES